MLLKQCGHFLIKAWLLLHDWAWNNFKFSRLRDWTTLLFLRKSLYSFSVAAFRLRKQYFLHCTRNADILFAFVGNFINGNVQGDNFLLQRSTKPQNKLFVVREKSKKLRGTV